MKTFVEILQEAKTVDFKIMSNNDRFDAEDVAREVSGALKKFMTSLSKGKTVKLTKKMADSLVGQLYDYQRKYPDHPDSIRAIEDELRFGKVQSLSEGASEDSDLEFVADQFVNNENASDKEMVDHLTAETGLDKNAIKKMVKKERTNFMNKPLASTDTQVKILRKYL